MSTENVKENVIAKVVISEDKPATAESFWIWIKKGMNIDIGTLVVAEDKTTGTKFYGIIEKLEAVSSSSAIEEFYSSKMGDPNFPREGEKIVEEETILFAKVRILWNNTGSLVAPTQRLKVRRMNKEEMEEFFKLFSSPEERIFGGLIKSGIGEEEWVPLFLSSSYLLGPEAAHINIAGTSGLASKTSYALFLVYSILQWSKMLDEKAKEDEKKKVAIILFNVKGMDFLKFHEKIENLDELLYRWSKGNEKEFKKQKKMYEILKDNGLDLVEIHNKIASSINTENPLLRYFTYGNDKLILPEKKKYNNLPVFILKYALWDLTPEILISAMFKEGENATQQESFIYRIFDTNKPEGNDLYSFERLAKKLESAQGKEVRIKGERELIIHSSSAGALARRIRGLLSIAQNIIDPTSQTLQNYEPWGPIQTHNRKIGAGINVIQIAGLSEIEQRIIVLDTIRKVISLLRNGSADFKYAVIVIDELNKYAPKEGFAAWKDIVTEIAERGRELLISLIGIEQLASKIDSRVLSNCSSFAVGKQNTVETKETFYKELGSMREILHLLEKGCMILKHPIYPSPLRIYFPIPPVKLLLGR